MSKSTTPKHPEIAIYEAQAREDALAKSEGRAPRLISTVECGMAVPKGNAVEARHIHEATSEVHNWLDSNGNTLDDLGDDRQVVSRLKCSADLLLAHDTAGDAEDAHEVARELAALAIFYMARGLS